MEREVTFYKEVELGEEGWVELECVAMFDVHIDKNYGADADGNRGTRRNFLTVNDVILYYNGNDVTKLIQDTCPAQFKEIEAIAEDRAYESS